MILTRLTLITALTIKLSPADITSATPDRGD